MKHMVNGKMFELPTEPDGSVDSNRLRKAAGIPDDRPLILQMPDGSNRVINPGERVYLRPGEAVIDAPEHVRGGGAGQAWPTLRTACRRIFPQASTVLSTASKR